MPLCLGQVSIRNATCSVGLLLVVWLLALGYIEINTAEAALPDPPPIALYTEIGRIAGCRSPAITGRRQKFELHHSRPASSPPLAF